MSHHLPPDALAALTAPLPLAAFGRSQAVALLVIVLVAAIAWMLFALSRPAAPREGADAERAPWDHLRDAGVPATEAGGVDGAGRVALCEAARGVAHAAMAQIWEVDETGDLVARESCGEDPHAGLVRLPERVRSALRTEDAPADEVVDAVRGPLLAATGALRLHAEPMLLGGRVTGFLATGWREYGGEVNSEVRSVLTLLAAHAAMMAERTELQRSARTDPLTGLPNRRAFDHNLAREMNRAARLGTPLVLAFIDLDGFKQLNDTAGHQAGDAALRASADAWSAQLRSMDVIGRYGGDEFAVLLPGATLEEAHEALDRLRQATPAGLGCSIGLTAWGPGESAEELLARADTALYASKRAGRDRTTTLDAPAPMRPPVSG